MRTAIIPSISATREVYPVLKKPLLVSMVKNITRQLSSAQMGAAQPRKITAFLKFIINPFKA
jgi:hypothetical protein